MVTRWFYQSWVPSGHCQLQASQSESLTGTDITSGGRRETLVFFNNERKGPGPWIPMIHAGIFLGPFHQLGMLVHVLPIWSVNMVKSWVSNVCLEGNLCPYLAQTNQFLWNNLITQGTPKGHHSRSKGPHGFAQKSWHSEGLARLRSRFDIMFGGKSWLIKKTCSWTGGVPWYARGENMNIFRKRNLSITALGYIIYIIQRLGSDMNGGFAIVCTLGKQRRAGGIRRSFRKAFRIKHDQTWLSENRIFLLNLVTLW